jgi:hypothetical protein
MASRIHASRRKVDPDTSLSSVRVVQFDLSHVNATLQQVGCTKTFLLSPRCAPTFFPLHICADRVVKSGMEDKSGPLMFLRYQVLLPDKEASRLILIPCSINPATLFLLDRLIYFPCLFKELRRGELRDGRITGITKTTRKARPA